MARAAPGSPPSGPAGRTVTRRELAAFIGMVLGMFMAILDIQIVSASIAEIQAGLSASTAEASWVQTSYLMANIVMIPLSGWLSRMMSTRILYAVSAVGFAVFSGLCATASSLPEMIAWRAGQGFIGGAMIPTVFATSYLLFPGKKGVQASVLIGMVVTLAPTVGPTLGGWLTQQFSWHTLFLINVPIGVAVAVAVWKLLDIDQPDWSLRRRLDWITLGLLAVFLASLEYVLEEGARWDWFEDASVRNLAIICGICGVLFFHRVLTQPDPLVELRAFLNPNFAIGSLFSFLLGIGLYATIYLIPLYLTQIRGFDAMQIGITMAITGATMFCCAPITGRLARVMDLRLMLAIGLFFYSLAIWLTARMTSEWGFWQFFWPQALRGAATIFVIVPVNQVALGTLPPAMLKNAAGLYNLTRNLGGAGGIAMVATMVVDRGYLHRARLADQVNWARPGVVETLHNIAASLTPKLGGSADVAALKRVAMLVERQALVLVYNDALMLIAAICIAAIPLTLLLARPRMADEPSR